MSWFRLRRGCRRWSGVVSAVGLLVMGGCDRAPSRSAIVITIDTLRADEITSGSLTRLAARGRSFPYAFAPSSSTAPSHTSIFTGVYPSWHTVGVYNAEVQLHPSTDTLAEILLEEGYTTGAIISNPILFSHLGLNQGFETYDDRLEGQELNRPNTERYADRALTLALAWLTGNAAEPFFFVAARPGSARSVCPPGRLGLWITTGRIEWPRVPRGTRSLGTQAIPRYQVFEDERRVGQYRHRYRCEVAFADEELGRLFELLESDPRFANTLVVVSADHGEAFGEDDFYFAHGHSVGLDQVHVPLILAGPGVPQGDIVRTPVTNVAIFATVLDYLGVDAPEGTVGPSLFHPDGNNPPPPVFVESINQLGIVSENAFLRLDRVSPDNTDFWRKGNPNSLGFWKPLGQEFVRPLDPERSAPSSLEGLAQKLRVFAARAETARRTCEQIRRGIILTPQEREALRSLGYMN